MKNGVDETIPKTKKPKVTQAPEGYFSTVAKSLSKVITWIHESQVALTTTLSSKINKRQIEEVYSDELPPASNSKRQELVVLPPKLEAQLESFKGEKNKLRSDFYALMEANIPYSDNEGVYDSLIKNYHWAGKLSRIFNILQKINFPYKNNIKICGIILERIYMLEDLDQNVQILKENDILYHGNEELCQFIIENSVDPKTLSDIFATLKKVKISYQDNDTIYLDILNNRYNAEQILKAIVLLNEKKISYAENKCLYEMIIHSSSPYKLAQAFVVLVTRKIDYKTHPQIYNTFVYNSFYADKAEEMFESLASENIAFQANEKLYIEIVNHLKRLNEILKGFSILKKFNIAIDNSSEIYHLVMQRPSRVGCFAELFVLIQELKIPYQNNNEIAKAIIKGSVEPLSLRAAVALLREFNIPYEKDLEICAKIIKDGCIVEQLAPLFAALQRLKITYQSNEKLYTALIDKHFYHNQKLLIGFSVIEKLKHEPLLNLVFCSEFINASYIPDLEDIIEEVDALRIPIRQNTKACLMIFNHLCSIRSSLAAFKMLWGAGVFYQNHPDLYHIVAETQYERDAARKFVLLVKEKIPYEKHKEFYKKVATQVNSKFFEIFTELYFSKIDYEHYPQYFTTAFFFVHDDVVLHTFQKLKSAGYLFETHDILFDAILILLTKEYANYKIIFNIINEVVAYAKSNTLRKKGEEGFEQQLQDLMKIISKNSSPEQQFVFGPLNKSDATAKIEQILESITHADVENAELIAFRSPETYILKLGDKPEINLSILLRNANLSHLTLNAETLDKLGKVLTILAGNVYESASTSNRIVNLLPMAEQKAVSLYIREYYANINKLFRSEPLSSNAKLNIQPAKNMLAYFLLGCLVNNALNRLKGLVSKTPERILLEKIAHARKVNMADFLEDSASYKKLIQESAEKGIINEEESKLLSKNYHYFTLLYPNKTMLERGETQQNEEAIKRRLNNAWSFPALTSFSCKKGCGFSFPAGTTTKKVTRDDHDFVINEAEGEVLFPHGEQVVTTSGPEYLLLAIKRSPSLGPKNHYLSEVALEEAFLNHLSKQYKEETSVVYLSMREIVRPNHGLAHTYRVMVNIEQVVDYFAHFAMDAEFKEFCQLVEEPILELLRVAAAFSVTGRESEITATPSNLERYNTYRVASATHFLNFINKAELPISDLMKDSIQHVVRYMGNPHYEEKEEEGGINLHADEATRKFRNFAYRILTIAHKMDLARCYLPDNYKMAMQLCLELSVKSSEQEAALAEKIRYNFQLIKAHGDALHCDIDSEGKLIEANCSYSNIFVEVSTSLKRLFEVSQTVPKPSLTLPFEFKAKKIR